MLYEKLRQEVLPTLIPPKSKILVAVSGGPDSIALAHILKKFAVDEPMREVSLVITHVNHGVRPESEQEEEMVRNLANSWRIPCIVHKFNAKEYAKGVGKSFQESAREWRYARWEQDRKDQECTLLATAHHLGDQAETVLYRLIRGSGTSGLAGIYPKQNEIIRPLLSIEKNEILHYCKRQGLIYALDQSNEQTLYVRNKIRLELIPELKTKYNNRIVQALGRTAEILRWDEEYLLKEAEEHWALYHKYTGDGEVILDRSVFKEPMAILSRILRKAIGIVNKEPRGIGFEFIERIIKAQVKDNWIQDLPGARVIMEQEVVIFKHPSKITEGNPQTLKHIEEHILLDEWTRIPELNLKVGLFTEKKASLLSEGAIGEEYVMGIDTDYVRTLKQPLVCRTRREGDTMWFAGVGHKVLKKVFQEKKVPSEQREFVAVIATGNDVLWIPGIKKSDRGKPLDCNNSLYLKIGSVNI